MPYNLVHRLRNLVAEDFPSQLETEHPILGLGPFELSEPILNEIDAIANLARAMFPRIEPDPRQSWVMAQEGFPVRPGKVLSGIWQNGFIQTPKGLIHYR